MNHKAIYNKSPMKPIQNSHIWKTTIHFEIPFACKRNKLSMSWNNSIKKGEMSPNLEPTKQEEIYWKGEVELMDLHTNGTQLELGGRWREWWSQIIGWRPLDQPCKKRYGGEERVFSLVLSCWDFQVEVWNEWNEDGLIDLLSKWALQMARTWMV